MNEKTGTCVSSEKENVKGSQSRTVTPSLDTPSGVGLGASQFLCCDFQTNVLLNHLSRP